MRRRLVASTVTVVVVVIGVLLVPVVLIVRDAESGDVPGEVFVRLAVIAATAIAAAALLAWVQARQLARPLERLSRAASRLGEGDFSVAGPPASGIDEIDDISRSLRLSASRVGRMLDAERGFTADATHQLRTGLTAIMMRLELLERSADPVVSAEAEAVLAQAHELNQTLDELLRVAPTGSPATTVPADSSWSPPVMSTRWSARRAWWAKCSASCLTTPSATGRARLRCWSKTLRSPSRTRVPGFQPRRWRRCSIAKPTIEPRTAGAWPWLGASPSRTAAASNSCAPSRPHFV